MKNIKNKKVLSGILLLAIMFVAGAIVGITNLKKSTKTKIDDKSFINLIDAKYDVSKQEVKLEDDKAIVKVNIVSKDLTKEKMLDLTKKIYKTTSAAKGKVTNVEVYFLNKDYKEFPGFYGNSLMNKANVDVEKNELKFFTYSTIPTIEKNVNATKNWSINKIETKKGTTYINLALDNKSKGDAVVSQVKGLTEMISKLNPDKKIEVAEYIVNPNEDNGFAYNTKYNNILASFEKISLK